ncbi:MULTISPECIES: 3-hydroxybutyryl-CoA dehydrogenase [unclassified Aeromicrobium]|uniref:3-hydroxybutyryl-CoA dehydrogenase n=1 Tax=unclassified Aeromicrobium TaxID=2633570 RepID=UPI00396AF12D
MRSIAVIGGGLMGSGIAEVTASSGVETVVVEVNDTAADRARSRIESSTQRAQTKGKLTVEDREALLNRIRVVTDIEAVGDSDIVIEAAAEDEATKLELFARLGKLTAEESILVSNTSSIPIVKLGAVTGRADRVMGVHFFNPAPVMPLVELVPSLTTSDNTVARMREFVETDLGKQAIEATDRAGFVVNSLLVPYLMSAIRMYEAGYATAADIDDGMMLGCGHPMGPLALSDLIGLDTVRAIGLSMYEEFKEPLFAPPPLLDRMVAAGLLGRKSGRGFYDHESLAKYRPRQLDSTGLESQDAGPKAGAGGLR